MKPLGLPTGSVRAILAIAVVGTFLVLVAWSVIRGDGELSPALGALVALAGVVMTKYFEKPAA